MKLEIISYRVILIYYFLLLTIIQVLLILSMVTVYVG